MEVYPIVVVHGENYRVKLTRPSFLWSLWLSIVLFSCLISWDSGNIQSGNLSLIESISAVCVDWEVVSGRGGQTTHLSPSDVLSQSPSLLYNLSKDCHVAFTHQGSCLVGFSRKDLLVYSFDQDATLRHSQRYKITCVAAHPSKDCIATGNKHGQVLLWWGSTI
jgi:hypothetical protein